MDLSVICWTTVILVFTTSAPLHSARVKRVPGEQVLARWSRQDDTLTLGGHVTIPGTKTITLLRIVDANKKIVFKLSLEPKHNKVSLRIIRGGGDMEMHSSRMPMSPSSSMLLVVSGTAYWTDIMISNCNEQDNSNGVANTEIISTSVSLKQLLTTESELILLDSLEMFDNGFADVVAMANDSSCSGLSVDKLEQLQRRHVVQRDDQPQDPMYKSKMADSDAASTSRELVSVMKDFVIVMKNMQKDIGSQTKETRALRQTLEECDMCRPRALQHTEVNSPCEPNPCFRGVRCSVTSSTGFACGPCPPGYTGDGVRCVRKITCDEQPCFEGVPCKDTESGYRCGPCPPRYTGDGTRNGCRPVRPDCSTRPCYPGVRCVDTSAGYRCGSCTAGFTGDGTRNGCSRLPDKKTCSDRPCFPGTQCHDTPSGYRCGACPTGMTGDGTREGCYPVDCVSGPCFAGVRCSDSARGYVCGPCPVGFTGDGTRGGCWPTNGIGDETRQKGCRLLSCADNPCFAGEKCTDTPVGVQCGPCPPGGVGGNSSAEDCAPTDNKPNQGVRYAGRRPNVDGESEVDREGNQPAYGRRTRPRGCDDKPCFPGVECRDTVAGVRCGPCPPGYEGNGTKNGCHRPQCRDEPCFPGVPCVDTPTGVTCGPCPPGMTGDGSRRGCRRVTCSDVSCFPGVECDPTPDGPKCGPCPEGMTGNGSVGGCRRLACSDAPCFPGVKCAVTERGINCGPCPPGFTGSGRMGDCSKIPQRLYCNDKPCYPGVYCVDTNTGVDCGPCPPGLTGDGLSCHAMTCSDKPCHPGVSCVATSSGAQCGPCPQGMTGSGYKGDCKVVVQVVTCADKPCHPGVVCTDTAMGAQCGPCPAGYAGSGMRGECRRIYPVSRLPPRPIKRRPFGKSGNLSENNRLSSRWGGQGRSRGSEVKPKPKRVYCNDKPCYEDVYCVDTTTSFKCGPCPQGYTGDGTKNGCNPMRCRDKPCYRSVPCFDTPTGPVCGQCPAGLTGDGTRSGCQSIVYRARRLRCSDGPCFRDGACRDTMDGFECGPCPEGYIGDGTARGCHRIE